MFHGQDTMLIIRETIREFAKLNTFRILLDLNCKFQGETISINIIDA